MCTVTLFPLPHDKKGFILTSNRDEAVARETLAPAVYEEEGVKLLYPKDVLAGGTWIGVSERNRAICLLNGGFKKHLPAPPYRKSRGEVVKDFLKSTDIAETLQTYLLHKIEPFTMIIVDWGAELSLKELVWDGQARHLRELERQPHLWSSASLYPPEVIVERKQRFADFNRKESWEPSEILRFHSSEGSAETESFVIDRGFLKTVSITQITYSSDYLRLWYKDSSAPKGAGSEYWLKID